MDVADVKRDIDELVRLRHPLSISIAGGEPLLYPHLDEVLDHMRARGVRAIIFTNALLLDAGALRKLKQKKVALIVIHVDKHQGRDGITTEVEGNRLRQQYCELFRRVGGVSLGFIQPMSLENLDDLDVLLPFFKENVDIIDTVTFIRKQNLDLDESPEYQVRTWNAMIERVREIYGLEYGAYLGKTHSDEISWIFGQAVFSGKKLLGSPDKDAFRLFREKESRRFARIRFLTHLPFNRSLRRIIVGYVAPGGWGRLNYQLIVLINPPRRLENGVLDRCDGCPDAMLYKGKLIPSCSLEIVKKGENIEAG
jgi:hypothetical protein